MTAHLWDRLVEARERLALVEPRYRVVFEDPAEPEAPCAVLVPAPEWLACALAGGILPPIETYLADQETPDGAPKLHPYAGPIGPMTEEEAMEYLVMKDLPRRVWADRTANAPRFRIVPKELVPSDRTYRNAWRLAA
jgi:hypothetical protein